MGLGNSRRGAVRNSTSKARYVPAFAQVILRTSAHYFERLDAGRSASPYVATDLGNLSDDSKSTTKGKGKSRAKQSGKYARVGCYSRS